VYDRVNKLGVSWTHPDKVQGIREASRPGTKKEVRSYLGLVGFFIPNCNCSFINGYDKEWSPKVGEMVRSTGKSLHYFEEASDIWSHSEIT
jgi:hypothetical protein